MEFCEFLSEDEHIEIVPNFTYNGVLNLITGDYGPFKPAVPTTVPLWMALNLFEQQKCRIKLPEWLDELEQLCAEQEKSPGLIKMPCDHWREMTKLLMKYEVVQFGDNLKKLIEKRDNIIKNSVGKLLDGVISIDEDQIAQVKIKNITKFEVTALKKMVLPNLAISKTLQKY